MEEKKLTDEETIKALEEYAEKNYEHCSYAEYIEACGVYCNHKKDFIADMGVKNGEDCRTCDMCDVVETAIVAKQTLDLINRLQAENERLTEDLKNCWQELIDSYREEEELQDRNAELQKQVDELKKYKEFVDACKLGADIEIVMNRVKPYAILREKAYKQAVKDTAKEICEMIDGTCISSKVYLCSIISKRYGVEVE